MEPAMSKLKVDGGDREHADKMTQKSLTSGYTYTRRPVRDITKEFTEASSALQLGQLVKDEHFTLFESVGALEIMDPKMDSGYVAPGEDNIMDDFDPLTYNLPEEIIALMDQLLCYEMSWHEGNPLSQTLFTSLHMYNLLSSDMRPLDRIVFQTKRSKDALKDAPLVSIILRAYCLGVAKCCDLVIREIMSEHYYEEEDFVTQTFTLDLLSTTSVVDITNLLSEATSTLGKLKFPSDIKDAIKDRLRFRWNLLSAFDRPSEFTSNDEIPALKALQDMLPRIDESHALGKLPSNCFTERVQRYLASNTPPRPILSVEWSVAFQRLKQMIEDNLEACRIHDVASQFSPHALMRFAWGYSSRKPQPSTYSRAVMQGLYFKNNGVTDTIPHIDLLVSDLREMIMAGDALFDPTNWEIELPSDPRHQMARRIDDFLSKSLEEYLNIYRMSLQNRCRMRRTFAQSITILDTLQAMAEDIDADIHAICASAPHKQVRQEPAQFYPLSAWVYHHKLRVMEWVVQLGFELDVYLRDEYSSMYSFLCHLSTTRSEHIQHISMILARRHALSLRTNPASAPEVERARTFANVQATQTTATACLANALSTLYTLLTLLNLIPTPPRPYSTNALRHELRMKPFLPIGTPGIPSYQDLHALTHPSDPETTIESLCTEAEETIKAAKRDLQVLKAVSAVDGRFVGVEEGWKREVQGLLMSAIAMGIAVAGVRRVCKEVGINRVGDVLSCDAEEKQRQGGSVVAGSEKVALVKEKVRVVFPETEKEGRYHEWWIVPKIVNVAQK